jgi:signal transduction histidine kinase
VTPIRLVYLFILILKSFGIASQVSFIDYPQICDFIFTDDNGLTYLSSTRGLYVYDGSGIPRRLDLQGLDNNNVQSGIITNHKEVLWFSTYNRLVQYNKIHGSTTSCQIVVEPGDTLISNYYIFDTDDDPNTFWIKENDRIFEYNSSSGKSTFVLDSLSGRRVLSIRSQNALYLLDYFATFSPSIAYIENEKCSRLKWNGWPDKVIPSGMAICDSNTVLIGTSKGLYFGDISQRKVKLLQYKEFEKGVFDISPYTKQSWIVSTRDTCLYILSPDSSPDKFKLRKLNLHPAPGLVNRILKNNFGTIYLSCYEKGIYYFHPENIKFTNYSIDRVSQLASDSADVAYVRNACREIEFTSTGFPFVSNTEYMLTSSAPYKQSLLNNQKIIIHPGNNQMYRYFLDQDDDIYASFLDSNLYSFTGHAWKIMETPKPIDSYINFYYNIKDSFHIASVDQEKLVTWTSGNEGFPSVLTFSGDVYSGLYVHAEKTIYFGTDQGLLKYDLHSQTFSLTDSNSSHPCFCLLQGNNADIWYSSFNQIFRYSAHSDSTVIYDISDGAWQYSARKCNAISPDSLLFYYIGGVTLIQPSIIKPLVLSCKVNLHNLKVNDILIPNIAPVFSLNHLEKEYRDNTISFDIISNDLVDAMNTRFRYKLKGYDSDWIYSEGNTAFVRYPRLPPGTYTFSVFGANSDGIWNTTPKELHITIHPPFYLTWWFITLATLALALIFYYIIRTYYRRKLEKKNQLLREQALIIEKQQAVENERTRIASEMHDDLGSGLTTIRYLSDKALTQAKDAEEAIQIKKIADHSNALVRNMSEIIWAMNARFDNADSLTSYLRRYASEFLEAYKLPLTFTTTEDALDQIPLSGERRRNIFLVFKEILHNTIKYSGANALHIKINTGDNFIVHITEVGGKGFDPETTIEKGNGIYNSRKRMTAIGGDIHYESTPEAMHIILSIPLQATHHDQT